jgi:hypothetical protein
MHIIEYKGYQIKPHAQNPTNYIVVTAGKGGKIPDIMNGMFTHPTLIKKLIDAYQESKPPKDTTNDKKINASAG